jgi:transcriptional regulator with XRE-family HTH domain
MPGRGELPPSGFGSRLRELRDEKGWTQKQLAEAAGIHVNTIARLERGEHEPAWPLVLAMTKALGVDCTAFSADVVAEPEPAEPESEAKPAPKKGKGKK